MAKKRTLLPNYGKINQRLESKAKDLQHGPAETLKSRTELANALFDKSDELRRSKKPFKSHGVRKLSKLHPEHPYRRGEGMTEELAKRFES